MSDKGLNQQVVLKGCINEKDFKEIGELEGICISKDNVNLKLELEYKLAFNGGYEGTTKRINEFLYYADGSLVGYLGISSFGGDTGEINGMVHPLWRRRGIFTKLYELAAEESRKRCFAKTLLLCDGKSSSAIEFIKSVGAEYAFSEYRMSCSKRLDSEDVLAVTLRKAVSSDISDIVRQDGIYFGDTSDEIIPPEEEEKKNRVTYMVELEGKVIGKIKVKTERASAFISGFGILPEFRGKGCGKQALKNTIKMLNNRNIFDISLDVACENERALNLYKSCGFEEESVMNYYEVK